MTGYLKGNQWVDAKAVKLAASASRTADGSGSEVACDAYGGARVSLDVTAGGADPDETLDVVVETSHDGGATWEQVGAFAQATGVDAQELAVSGLGTLVRCSWTVAGTTPDFTFEVSAYLV